jgi:hypothetical protein
MYKLAQGAGESYSQYPLQPNYSFFWGVARRASALSLGRPRAAGHGSPDNHSITVWKINLPARAGKWSPQEPWVHTCMG